MKSKQLLGSALVALAITALFAPAAKATTGGTNDLYLGIFDASSSNDYVVDLGSVSNFVSGTPYSVNLNADLSSSSLFGANYYTTDTSLVFSLIGYKGISSNPSSLLVSEDSANALVDPPVGFSKAGTVSAANGVLSVINGYNNASAAGTTPNSSSGVFSSNVGNAVIQPASETSPGNSYEVEYNSENEFQTGDDLVTSVNGGVLDLYALPVSYGGAPTLLGTATISNTGEFTFEAAPEPSTYGLMAIGLGMLAFLRRRLTA